MSTIINLGDNQLKKFSQILSKHLSRSFRGRRLIKGFRQNRDAGWDAILEYLNARLPEDEILQSKIASTLGKVEGKHFINIVTEGGNVGEMINIVNLDKLEIRYYVFSDVRQVVAFYVGIVLIGSIVYSIVWWFQQPHKMAGDFNIAVAEFVQTGEEASIAPIVSQRIHSFLDGQYNLSSFEDVEVAHKNIDGITNAEEARILAEKIDAHLVIYGDVTVISNQVLVSPQFYVVESHQFDVGEVNGEHKLAARISLLLNELVDPPDNAPEALEQSTKILIEFTKSLVYLAAGTPGDLILARESIGKAISEGESYGDFEGKEVLYLFASDIARRLDYLDEAQVSLNVAMDLNTNYGRGYIAQANIYYDNEDLNAAMETYKYAMSLEDQPYGSYIQEKASLGVGNCCNIQFQNVLRREGQNSTNIANPANCALLNYQAVITSFNQQNKPGINLQEMAAWAYYGSGIVYQETDQFDLAEDSLAQVLYLTNNPELETKATDRINSLAAR